MKEILAEDLSMFFINSGIDGKRTYSGDIYEVWEVSDSDFELMCNMSEDWFQKLCPNGMWRHCKGSNQGIPDKKYSIRGHELIAWDGNTRNEYYYDAQCRFCDDRIKNICGATQSEIEECNDYRKYDTLLKYFCSEIGVSQPKNVCALATDLAKYNNMTLGELFNKYEGGKENETDRNNKTS